MLFNSFQFFVFFPLVLLAYFLTPHRLRWATALAASYYFYMCWKPAFIVLIIASTMVDYVVGIGLAKAETTFRRRALLCASLALNLGLLFTFKYLDFALRNVEEALRLLGMKIDLPHPELVLPVGISFYTFQTLSYTIDVFNRKTPTEYHFGRFATYVAFFPQLVAGPIERSSHLLPQFSERAYFEFDRLAGGLKLILWGLFKKMCVADLLSTPVETIYNDPARFDGSYLLLGTLMFGVQIYCDFSAYSDIAIGSARALGIDLMTNFRQPYFAKSVGEFWQRWHISLSTWFRDYVYIPLGGSRCSANRWVVNVLIVFLVSGFWHGAAWGFIIWGALHGMYLVLERLLGPVARASWNMLGLGRFERLRSLARIVLTFWLVMITWVFFRAQQLDKSLIFLEQMFDWSSINLADLDKLGLPTVEMLLCFTMPVVLFVVDYALCYRPAWVMRWWRRDWVRSVVYALGLAAIMMFGVFDEVDFIYFQF